MDCKATLPLVELLCDCPTLVQIHLFSKINWFFFQKNQNTVVGKPNRKIHSSKTFGKLTLLVLANMVNTGQEPGSVRVSTYNVLSLTRLIFLEISTSWFFQQDPQWDCKWEMNDWKRDGRDNKCDFVVSGNIDKFYHGLNEKLFTVNNILDDFVFEDNFIKIQEVGYLASWSCQQWQRASLSNNVQYQVISLVTRLQRS